MAFFIVTGIILIVAVVLWLVFGGAKEDGRVNQDKDKQQAAAGGQLAVIIVGTLLIVGFILIRVLHTVGTGHVGLVTQFGNVVDKKDAGFVTIAPWQSINELTVREQKAVYNMVEGDLGSAVSIDNQAVFARITLRYQVRPEAVVELFRDVGARYKEVVIDPLVPQVFKATTAKYKAVAIAGSRERLRQQTQHALDLQLEKYGIQAVDTLVTNIDFTDQFRHALEATQVAKQRALEEESRVAIAEAKAKQAKATAKGEADAVRERAKGEAEAKLVVATAEAKGNKLLAQSITSNVINLKAVEALSPGIQTILLPSGSNFLLPAEVFGKKK